jgi:hypothetical protein
MATPQLFRRYVIAFSLPSFGTVVAVFLYDENWQKFAF